MPIFDRIILYATAVMLGFVLLKPDGATEQQTVPAANPTLPAIELDDPVEKPPQTPEGTQNDLDEVTSVESPPSPVTNKTATSVLEPAGDSQASEVPERRDAPARLESPMVLRDAIGRPRIELIAERDGCSIRLNDAIGEPAVELSAADGGAAEVTLQRDGSSVALASEDDGSVSVTLDSISGRGARMLVKATGETEVSAGAGPDGLEVLLRTDAAGAAEIAIRAPDGKPAPTLSMLPNGDAGVAIRGAKGSPGPIMTRFADGLSEIAIRAAGAEDGPRLLRLSNGLSIVAVHHKDGHPAASLVAAPDGSSVIAAESRDGRQRAAMQIGRNGKPSIGTTDPESESNPEDEDKPVQPEQRQTTAVSGL